MLRHFEARAGDLHLMDAAVADFVYPYGIFGDIQSLYAVGADALQRHFIDIAFKHGLLRAQAEFFQKLPHIIEPLRIGNVIGYQCDHFSNTGR
jgi:hypothetical protein